MSKDFLRIKEKYGYGTPKKLTRHQLDCLYRICNNFRKLLVENCEDYLLYRCTLTSDGTIIYATIACSDLDGTIVQTQLGYDYENLEIYTRKINIKNECKVSSALFDLVVELTKIIPYQVGMLDFPIEGRFEEGTVRGYKDEKGSYLIVIEDSLDNGMFMK